MTRHRRSNDRPAGTDTASRLLDAAEQVFSELGFAGATTAGIAERAGVTKALVHYYFRSKESLHQAVMERYERAISQLLLEDLGRHAPQEAISAAIRRYCAFLAEHPRFVRLSLYNALDARCTDRDQPMFRRLVKAITRALEQGMELGVFRVEDTRHVLVSIDAMCSYFFEHESEVKELWGEDNYDRQRVVMEHVDHVVRMVELAIRNPVAHPGQVECP